MASVESIMAPRTDSSASRLWGGTRSGRRRRTSSALVANDPPLPDTQRRDADPRCGSLPSHGENPCGFHHPRYARKLCCHTHLHLPRDLWKTPWRHVYRRVMTNLSFEGWGPLFGGFDLDRDDGVDVGEQVHPHLVDPDTSDGLVQVDVVAVHLHPGLSLDLLRELGGRHAAEQPALLAHPGPHLDRARGQPVGHLLGFPLLQRNPGGMGPLEALDVLDPALGRSDREAPWHQVVPGIAVGDVDHVPRHAELVDGLLEDDLHRLEYGRSAISRAFLTATATSR